MLNCHYFDGVTPQDTDMNGKTSDFFGAGVVHPTSDFALTFPTPNTMGFSVGQGTAYNVNGVRFLYDANPAVSLMCVQADPTNPRIDLVEIGYAFSTPGISKTVYAQIIIKQGTPAASPAQPAVDTGYTALYAIRVNAGVTSINASNITDLRTLVSLQNINPNINIPDLPLLGGTMQGDINANTHKITNVSEIDMTGSIVMANNKITGLGAGINLTDGVNFGQVQPNFNSLQGSELKVTSNTAISITSNNNPFTGSGCINLTINTGSSGVNGLDTGTLAASSWYSVWDIYNPTTQTVAGIMALMPTLTGNVTSGSNVVTNLSSTTNMVVGMPIGSVYFPAGTIVTSIDSSTQIHVSNNALATQTGASIIFMYNPVMPSGYTIKIRVGTALTDSSKYLMRINYAEKDAQYIETVGSNTTVLPTIASGAQGSFSPLTFVTCSLMGLIPPTASRIRGVLQNLTVTGGVAIATNNNFGSYNSTTNPPPAALSNATGQQIEQPFDFLLESMYLYYAGSASGQAAFCFGWKDNL